MTDLDLTLDMCVLGGVSDFLVLFKNECHPEYNGLYYLNNKVAVIYILDEEGNRISDNQIIKTAIHELTHHILNQDDVALAHDKDFKKLFNKLLKCYYRNNIPEEVLEILTPQEMEN